MRIKSLVLFAALALFCVALPALAQGAAPNAPLAPPFEVMLSAGQIATASSGSAAAYKTSFETNLGAAFRWNVTDHVSLGLSATSDTAKIGRWLMVHQFVTPKPVQAYTYWAYDLTAQYFIVRGAQLSAFVFAGPSLYWADGHGKGGLVAGLGAQYALTKHWFIESQMTYRHEQGLIVPVANVYGMTLLGGFRF